MMRIDLNDISMNTGVPDANGALWYATDWDGWDAPALRQTLGEITSRNGTTVLESMLSNRPISVSGVCKARGEDGYWAAYNDLLSTTNNLSWDRPFVVYESTPKFAGFIRGGTPKIDGPNGSNFTFQVPLICNDPMKYAVAESKVTIAAGATATVTSYGSYTTYPVLSAASSVNHIGLERVDSGEVFELEGGSLHGVRTVDMRRRTAYSVSAGGFGLMPDPGRGAAGGGRMAAMNIPGPPVWSMGGTFNDYGYIKTWSTWWALQPGPNKIRNFSSGSITLTFHDAWI